MNLLTQTEQNIGGPLEGIGTYKQGGANSPTLFTEILTKIIGVITIVAGIWFIFLLITGGIEWMSSGGDKGKLASARSKMFSGAVGLAIVVAALFIAQIFGGLIGIDNILNPAEQLKDISP